MHTWKGIISAAALMAEENNGLLSRSDLQGLLGKEIEIRLTCTRITHGEYIAIAAIHGIPVKL